MSKSSLIKRHGGLLIISPEMACAIGMTANHEGQKLEESFKTWGVDSNISRRDRALIDEVVRYHEEVQRRK